MYDKVPQLDVKGYKVVMNLEESATYYYIKNTDFLLAMPSLEPMVYIGKEIMGGSEHLELSTGFCI